MKDWTLKPAIALSLLASSLVGLGAAASASAAARPRWSVWLQIGDPTAAPDYVSQ